MKRLRIALYPGDGIGRPVTESAVKVLDKICVRYPTIGLDFEWFDWGCDYYDLHGKAAPDDMIETLRPFDAVFLGAVGYPSRCPDHITLEPLIRMRQAFDQYACVRPSRTYDGVPMPLAAGATVDMVVVRENSEGEYINNGGRFHQGKPEEVALQTAVHTRRGVERVLRQAFELAGTPERRGKVTMATKSNAQIYSMVSSPSFSFCMFTYLYIKPITVDFWALRRSCGMKYWRRWPHNTLPSSTRSSTSTRSV
jgi:tartrate dehydrogenase/decarboxylase/D-malate dehydrogenase